MTFWRTSGLQNCEVITEVCGTLLEQHQKTDTSFPLSELLFHGIPFLLERMTHNKIWLVCLWRLADIFLKMNKVILPFQSKQCKGFSILGKLKFVTMGFIVGQFLRLIRLVVMLTSMLSCYYLVKYVNICATQ